jgi:hypothetical protein
MIGGWSNFTMNESTHRVHPQINKWRTPNKKCFKMHKNTFSSKLGKYAIASFFAFDILPLVFSYACPVIA